MLTERFLDKIKLQLVESIRAYSVKHSMNQTDMAYLLDTAQPRVSLLMSKRVDKFSLDTLMKWNYNLGINVTIQINQ